MFDLKIINGLVYRGDGAVPESTNVAIKDGKVVGSIGLNRTSPWYSDAEYIADGWLYVLQEYRKSGVAGMLSDKAKEFAEEKELPLIIGIFSKEDAIAKAGIMNKLGLIAVGGLFAAGV